MCYRPESGNKIKEQSPGINDFDFGGLKISPAIEKKLDLTQPPRVISSELRTPNSELRTPNSELRTPNSELRTPNSELSCYSRQPRLESSLMSRSRT